MKIVAIGAHFDDLELACGGTIARFTSLGHTVDVIMTSRSDYADAYGNVLRTELQAKSEGVAGLKVLGVDKIVCLNYPTKEVVFCKQLIESINRYFDLWKPDFILAPSQNESHQDHYNTSKAVMSAGRYQKTIWTYETLYPSKTTNTVFRPTLYVDITEQMQTKLDSLKAHTSQFSKYEHWTDLVTSLARVRGIENQCKYAEAYDIIRMEQKL